MSMEDPRDPRRGVLDAMRRSGVKNPERLLRTSVEIRSIPLRTLADIERDARHASPDVIEGEFRRVE
jgi:hypothetical protein